jgi:hypothetical protein
MIQNTKREKIHALSLAKECYSMKLDLLTATVVDDAIRFISSQEIKENKPPSSHQAKTTKKNQTSLIMMKTKIS